MAIEVTDEMRAAVIAELCANQGHTLLINAQNQSIGEILYGTEPDELPHIKCSRCGKVWVMSPIPRDNYDTAESALLEYLTPENEVRSYVLGMRERRNRGRR